jgi:replicative DNA helicase
MSVDSEAVILAALLRDNTRVDSVADILAVEDFSEDLFGRLYSTIIDLVAQRRAANAMIVAALFQGDAAFESVGGRGFLIDMGGSLVSLLDVTGIARHLRDLAVRRRLVARMAETSAALADLNRPIDVIIAEYDAAASGAVERTDPNPFRAGADCVDEVVASFDRPVVGVSSGGGVTGIDRLIGVIRPGWLGIVAGRPGMGKTAALVSYLRGTAGRGHTSLFASLEMTWETLSMRLVADHCHAIGQPVPFDAMMGGRLSHEHKRIICRARDDIAALPFKIIDKRCHTLGQLRRAVRRRKRELAVAGRKLELVVVDYLQLLMPDRPAKSEYDAVSEVSRELKLLAGDEEVAVIALSQLSRNVEQRADHRPVLADLRSSGQIEQDADFVVFLLSEEYYLRKAEPEADTAEHDAWRSKLHKVESSLEFICAKHRHGREGNFYGRFYRDFQAVR